MPKIGVVGAGNVGATAALYAAQLELGDVMLVDIVDGVPQGKALDMLEAGPVLGYDSAIVGSNDFAALEGSDIVVVTAGLARKPGMDRLDLLKKNAEIITSVTENIVKYAPDSQILMVSNPLDVMTYIALKVSGFGRKRVYGQAGVLDCARYRSFVAMELGVSMEDTAAMILGGHGDTMVPIPRYTTVSGIPITELISQDRIDAIVQRTRDGGAEIVNYLKKAARIMHRAQRSRRWWNPCSGAKTVSCRLLSCSKGNTAWITYVSVSRSSWAGTVSKILSS